MYSFSTFSICTRFNFLYIISINLSKCSISYQVSETLLPNLSKLKFMKPQMRSYDGEDRLTGWLAFSLDSLEIRDTASKQRLARCMKSRRPRRLPQRLLVHCLTLIWQSRITATRWIHIWDAWEEEENEINRSWDNWCQMMTMFDDEISYIIFCGVNMSMLF